MRGDQTRARKGTRRLRAGRHRIPDTVYSSNLNERGSPAQDAPQLCGPMITITTCSSYVPRLMLYFWDGCFGESAVPGLLGKDG